MAIKYHFHWIKTFSLVEHREMSQLSGENWIQSPVIDFVVDNFFFGGFLSKVRIIWATIDFNTYYDLGVHCPFIGELLQLIRLILTRPKEVHLAVVCVCMHAVNHCGPVIFVSPDCVAGAPAHVWKGLCVCGVFMHKINKTN